MVPLGNPDRIQSASAQKWGKYDVSKRMLLRILHIMVDLTQYMLMKYLIVAPLDMLKEYEKEDIIEKYLNISILQQYRNICWKFS